jgi:3-phenylpropionate/cinnamic acid dioxygenase small subunit
MISDNPSSLAIAALLRKERDLLDRGDLDAWRQLFTTDGVYWMPSDPAHEKPLEAISLMLEGQELMEIRARNFGHAMSPSMAHPLRSCRLMEIRSILPSKGGDGEWQAIASFHAVISYRQEQQLFAGSYTYLVAATGTGFLIRQKRVDILNVDQPIKSVLIYI